ncbi:MAG: DUF3343 domain-containing protein [Dysosmobacter sp.]
MTYIATFYSHFGAIRCKKLCEAHGLSAPVMPVPRDLSSSCGTCVRWEGELPAVMPKETKQIVQVLDRATTRLSGGGQLKAKEVHKWKRK